MINKFSEIISFANKVNNKNVVGKINNFIITKNAQNVFDESNDSTDSNEIEQDQSDEINVAASLFSQLKANLEYSQVCHWAAKGLSGYADHLLFERIYDENQKELDKIPEKLIPVLGESFINPIEISVLVSEKIKSVSEFKDNMDSTELVQNLFNCEEVTLNEIETFRAFFEKNSKLSLGLDDLITEIHNTHQSHVYLLKQRLK